jgi:LDH2 family malate/lactate/ureidoglycolate dehydrogenase
MIVADKPTMCPAIRARRAGGVATLRRPRRESTPVPDEPLILFATRVLTAVAVPDEDASLVARSLVQADLWGHSSHGLLRLPWYVDRIRSGVMDPLAKPHNVVDTGAVAVLDGREGVGQVIAWRACEDAVWRAKEHGVGVVAARNSNHFGMNAFYTRAMAEEGCVGILTTNGSPAMAPWGGRVKTVGANPWSVAVPAGRHGVAVMDIANTTVARGKVYAALERGKALPEGWALDSEGSPTTDPVAALEGLILPMAGHKGYAISFMMDVLSGVLTGSSSGTGVSGPYQTERRSGCGHLAIALDVATFIDPDDFARRMEALIAEAKSVPLAAGASEIFFPGEIEDRAAAERESVELPPKTLESLAELGRKVGVPFDGPA